MTVLHVVGVVMRMRGRIHRHLRRVVVNAQFLMMRCTGRHAQHCRAYRTADGQQHSEHYQEPGANGFH